MSFSRKDLFLIFLVLLALAVASLPVQAAKMKCLILISNR